MGNFKRHKPDPKSPKRRSLGWTAEGRILHRLRRVPQDRVTPIDKAVEEAEELDWLHIMRDVYPDEFE